MSLMYIEAEEIMHKKVKKKKKKKIYAFQYHIMKRTKFIRDGFQVTWVHWEFRESI